VAVARSCLALGVMALAGCDHAAERSASVDIAGAARNAQTSVAAYSNTEREQPAATEARSTVRRYMTLLAHGRAVEAMALWEPDATPDAQAFTDSIARYRGTVSVVGAPARRDAGAGQRYATVPVTLGDGDAGRTSGTVTLRRTVAEGASREQRAWRIMAADLPAPPAVLASGMPATASALYVCSGGGTVRVKFDNRADTATIATDETGPVTLLGQRPASGIWYAGGGYDLRGKGREATITMPRGTAVTCIAKD
jgi:membrane-bound inhibitor of C-type lysozyme